MTFRTTFASLQGPQASLSLFDGMFNDLAGEIYIPCTAAGSNSIALTPFAFAPSLAAYTELCGFAFKAAANATGSVTAQFASLASLPVYLADGVTVASSGNILLGQKYGLIYSGSLNSGGGGFFLEQPAVQVSNSQFAPGTLGGLGLSNDVGGPNSFLDIAAGAALNSTNATLIKLATAITKNTSGAWVTGSGNAGMGTGLTVAPSTWYHVFVIINAGVTDAYFDTSVAAANAPAGTSSFRRIGSIRTNNLGNITPFTQLGNYFDWKQRVTDVNTTPVSGTQNTVTLTVPPGVPVIAHLTATAAYTAGAATTLFVYPSDLLNTPLSPQVISAVSLNSISSDLFVRTSTAAQIFTKLVYGTSVPYLLETQGWQDLRGQT